jgi:hypothetical protein
VHAKLDRLVTEPDRSADELADVRATLDSRYDDLKSGRVKPRAITSSPPTGGPRQVRFSEPAECF